MKTTNVIQAAVGNEGVSDDALEMSIDESSSVFLMDALGKLYSQPARAALREYLANGIDAHVEAGGKRPAVEITLPSHENRTLSIRDFGNGISEENFKNILRRYGASTKRHSNKLTGGFGLGAKAGFALNDEFHMTSFQNGHRLKVRIFKNASGKGFIEVIERGSTSLADGLLVELDVPAGNVEELSYESLVADKFFSAYRDSEVQVTAAHKVSGAWGATRYEMKRVPVEDVSLHNTENYEPLEYGGSVIGWIGKATGVRRAPVRAIVGRVAYTVKHDSVAPGMRSYGYSALTNYSDKFGPAMQQLAAFGREIILNLPIGSVDLPSSREEITYNERSLKTIVAISTSVHRIVEENVQRSVNAKATGHEALVEIIGLHSDDYWKASSVMWRGQAAPVDEKATKFNQKAEIVRYHKTDDTRNSLKIKTVTSCYPTELRNWAADTRTKKVMIVAKDEAEFALAMRKMKSNITDFHKSQDVVKNVEVFLFPPNESLAFWFEHGEKMTLDEFLQVGKAFRAAKRAEAKALQAARGGNPAFNTPVKTSAATREVFFVPVNTPVTSSGITLRAEQELNLLTNQSDFYYLSKAEVKELSSELSNLFPTRQGVGGSSAFIDTAYARLLPSLSSILGQDAKIVFVPATRNMEEFVSMYPHVPSIVSALKGRIAQEWNNVKSGKKMDTYLSEIFWLVPNRNRVSLVNQFFRELTPGEKVSMNADLLELNTYMDSTSRAANSRLHVLVGELMGVSYISEISGWMEKKVTAVGKRYPILTLMNPVGARWDELKPEMIRYLKTCK